MTMTIQLEDIKKDIEFQKAIGNNLAEESIKSYSVSLLMFCRVNQKPFTEIVEEIKKEQYDRIEGNKVVRYDPNNGIVNYYLNNLTKFYKEENRSCNTINTRMGHVRTLLKNVGIILPVREKVRNNSELVKERIISRKEIGQILEHSNIWQKSHITFLASTGMRIQDFVNLTIDDFIDATFEYHNIVDVDEFIDEAPKDMIGYWVFYPHKTKRLGLECRVCNTPESSNHLLETLRIRKEKLAERGIKLTGDDPLFITMKSGFNRKIQKNSLSANFWTTNKEFRKEMEKELGMKLKNREISRKEYKKRLENLPRLHPHGLRKFFTTTVRNYTTNRDISLIMEGHTSPYKMDKHYVGVNEELFSDEKIKETYETVIPYLTFQKEISADEYYALKDARKKYLEQLEYNIELEKKINQLDNVVKDIIDSESVMSQLEKKF